MKHFWIWLTMPIMWACQQTMEPWQTEQEGQEVSMYVRTRGLSGITSSPSAYQFFILNKANETFTRYQINPSSQMQLKLVAGDYIGYCVTGGDEEEDWIFEEQLSAEEIFLKAQKNSKSHEEAKDHLLGKQEFSITDSNPEPVIFDLERKVSMLRVHIENIPEWVTDLQINLSNVAAKMNLVGTYAESYTVTKDITLPENGNSITSLLVFPPLEENIASLTLSSNSLVFITPEHPIDSILPNRITEIKAVFLDPLVSYAVNFTNRIVDWDSTIIYEEDWTIDAPLPPCEGHGNGIELVANGELEELFVDNIPPHWTLDASNKETIKTVHAITTPVYNGDQAVLIEGKTYIYQDIPVIGGNCYQLHLYINAPNDDAKWKCYSTWYKGSTKLTSNLIQSSDYEGKTEGYIDFYQGKVFRAPAEATKLRIEIRNYNDPIPGEGIYMDAVSVQAVD